MNVFDLYARIALDTSGYENDLNAASEKTNNFAGKLKSGLKTAAKVGAAAITAAGSGIAALTKQSIDGYAEYEQLVGGVETLFKQSADVVQQYAANAYKTAGLSANEYMETVTSFSASLLQSLDGDTKSAAEKANVAITDMSDNANKMGTSMESIQNAYQGFAKQNFTMLDNLKLGYGGTKEEMQRLLDKANELNAQQGVITDYQIDSYADIVDAIHVVQTEMGITGTTAKEASTTIQGSVSSMKSAWKNLVTGLADDRADFGALMDNFVESVVTVGENIIPRIETTITGITTLVSSASENLIPLVVETLINNLPALISAGMDLVIALVNGILDNIDILVDSTVEMIDVIVDKLIENLPKLIEGGIKLVVSLANGLIKAIPELVSKLPEIISAIVNGLISGIPDIIEVGVNLVKGLWEGIKSMGTWLWDSVKGFLGGIVDGVKDFLGIRSPSKVFAGIGGFMAEGLGKGFNDSFGSVKKSIESSMDFGVPDFGINVSAPHYSAAQMTYAGQLAYAGAGQTISIPITLELDGAVLARKTYSYNQSEVDRHGKSFVR